jgi:hypothetical protein
MSALFGDTLTDIGVAVLVGAIGGFVATLAQDHKLTLPHTVDDGGAQGWDPGFLDDILFGMVAAALSYITAQPSSQLSLLSAALIAGIGGRAIVKGYLNGKAADAHAALSDKALALAQEAVDEASGQAVAATDLHAQAGALTPTDQAPPSPPPAPAVDDLRNRLQEMRNERNQLLRRWA